MDREVTLEMTILVQIEVDLEKDNTQVTSEEMREAVVDQDQEKVVIEIGLDSLSVGSKIIWPKIF